MTGEVETHERRRLAVIMFTDLVGYSALSQRDEALSLQLLEEHRRIVRPLLAQHGGREVKTIGDAFLVEFASALAATLCAADIQRAHRARNEAAAGAEKIQLRIGLHAGDVLHRENDVYGDGVNIASRIEPLAEAGGICISEDVARQVRNKIPHPVVKLGSGELKNIAIPVDIYRVVLPWQNFGPRDQVLFFLAKKSVRRAAAAVLLVILAAAIFFLLRPGAADQPSNRLAVLPLENLGGGDDYFADGLTEELISTLATMSDLNVIARTSVTRFKGAGQDIAEIGRRLNVGSILEGSVRMAGNETRISVSLVDARTQNTLWSREFTRSLKDVFAVQSEIAMSVADALKVELLTSERSQLARQGPATDDAYREYLSGRTHLSRRTGDDIIKAIGSFTRAIDLDPGFALAHAGLAECYTLAGVAGYGDFPRDVAVVNAKKYAEEAVRLGPQLAEAHAALAYARFRIDWDWDGTEKEFKRAIELKPGIAHTHELYGLYLAIRKRLGEGLAEMQKAQQLDPLSPSVSNGVGRILHFQRKYDAALAQFTRTLALNPGYAEAHFSVGMTYTILGQFDAAIASIKKAIELSGNRPVMLAMLAVAESRAGNAAEARRIRDDLAAQARSAPVSPYYFGIIDVGLGDLDAAMREFDAAYVARDGILIYLPVDPIAEVIWTHPDFPALVKKMGLN